MNDTLSSRLPFQPSQINETLSPPPPPPCDGVMFEAFRGGPTAAPRSSCLSPCPVLFWAPGTGDMGGAGSGTSPTLLYFHRPDIWFCEPAPSEPFFSISHSPESSSPHRMKKVL